MASSHQKASSTETVYGYDYKNAPLGLFSITVEYSVDQISFLKPTFVHVLLLYLKLAAEYPQMQNTLKKQSVCQVIVL